ncbi:hypothetical protein ACFORH_38930 [Amycolatopsis roodepoortensis]|uniref:MFS family permease n=1 Tax=Amycolatopsis roodepoortensis TaxID=700274 RepID=A0ABR9LIG3_9PSEU|nr:hypothetical protein [Amycolatopsis roodepoortensis]MBE1580489.1 MFS family permease [Amycolatopsis roodepoortensis]
MCQPGNLLATVVCEVVRWGDTASTLAPVAAQQGAQAVGGSVLDGAAKSAGQAAGQLITTSLGWWTVTSSVDFGSPALKTVRAYTMPLTMILLTLGVIAAAIRTALARKGEPLMQLVTNLVTFIIISAAGLGLLAAIQAGGEAYSAWILKDAGKHLGDRFAVAAANPYTASFGIIMISLFAILVALVQWILMLFRTAALVVLAGMLPLAGAASVLQGRTDSIKTVVTWSLTIVIYPPVGATIYATGFLTLGTGADLLTMLRGLVILIMAVIALPMLAKLFSWAGTSLASGGGGLAAAAGLAGLAMARRGAGKGKKGDSSDTGGDSDGDTDGTDTGGPDPSEGTNPGGLATEHTREMETGGPESPGGSRGDTPANSDSAGPAEEPGPGAAADLADPTPSGGEDEAAAAATAGASGGATAGGDTPATSGGGGNPVAAQAEQAIGAAESATETATDPAPLGSDEPT